MEPHHQQPLQRTDKMSVTCARLLWAEKNACWPPLKSLNSHHLLSVGGGGVGLIGENDSSDIYQAKYAARKNTEAD
jgi:hypothetical protein